MSKGTKVLRGVTLDKSTPQWELLENPRLFHGKKVRIEGSIVGICRGRGCWAAVRGPKGQVINLKVDDGVVDFREVSKMGQYAIGEGIFSKVGRHGAQVKITGAMISPNICR